MSPIPAVAAQVAPTGRGPVLPLVGMLLWYWPHPKEVSDQHGGTISMGGMIQHGHGNPGEQPLRMHVDFVREDGTVNGTVTDHAGRRHVRHGVQIRRGDDAAYPDPEHGFAESPPGAAFAFA